LSIEIGGLMSDLLVAVTDALGLSEVQVLTQGGQKIVLTATLAGVPAIAKIVCVPDGPDGQVVVERSHREVELLAAVSSPAVVRLLSEAVEIGDPVEAVCWVEERLAGEDLALHLNHLWSETDAWALVRDLAVALRACHELDVVHRDLSARNVRRLPTGRFVLMDPGLARHLTKAALTGVFQPGTPGWRSPEHVPGGNPVFASDIFSLGILLYYALTARFPIDPTVGDREYDRALATTQVPSVAHLRPDISEALVELIDLCLQKQPARRFLDGAELVDHLQAIGQLATPGETL
jgi:serine/threonine protein kinase